MSSFTHLYPSFKTHPKCHLLQEIPPPQSTPKQTWSLLQLVLGIDHIPSCFHFLETISGCQRQCAPAHMSQFCASLPNSRLSEIMLVVWTQPWWEYLCQDNRQAQQIRAPTPSESWLTCTFLSVDCELHEGRERFSASPFIFWWTPPDTCCTHKELPFGWEVWLMGGQDLLNGTWGGWGSGVSRGREH